GETRAEGPDPNCTGRICRILLPAVCNDQCQWEEDGINPPGGNDGDECTDGETRNQSYCDTTICNDWDVICAKSSYEYCSNGKWGNFVKCLEWAGDCCCNGTIEVKRPAGATCANYKGRAIPALLSCACPADWFTE
ncbi:MAG: hypothetical protein LBG46_01800, partial [Elusimicrobiota bacterium]|nr:hypothetical protein [Elusimicrobiota bacterium]